MISRNAEFDAVSACLPVSPGVPRWMRTGVSGQGDVKAKARAAVARACLLQLEVGRLDVRSLEAAGLSAQPWVGSARGVPKSSTPSVNPSRSLVSHDDGRCSSRSGFLFG